MNAMDELKRITERRQHASTTLANRLPARTSNDMTMPKDQHMPPSLPLTPNQRVGILLCRVAGWVCVGLSALCVLLASQAGKPTCAAASSYGECLNRHDLTKLPTIFAGVFIVAAVVVFFVVGRVRKTLTAPWAQPDGK